MVVGDESHTGWRLFDEVVEAASAQDRSNPWVLSADGEDVRYLPDYDTLRTLLAVPSILESKSQTRLPALAIDIWVAYELRRAGFDPDWIWPRARVPRILPTPISQLLSSLPANLRKPVEARIESGAVSNGAVTANARILGKHYFKQVDVVVSAWDTGPEVLISTKRMDKSFNRNAANRVEESYGDAKNLRLRHPLAAMGFVYALNADAFRTAPDKAAWLLDLLAKLGRESDAYDAVLLIVPDYGTLDEPEITDDEDGSALEDAGLDVTSQRDQPTFSASEYNLAIRVSELPQIGLLDDKVPAELSAPHFFETVIRLVLDRTPVTRHRRARELLEAGSR